MGVMGLESQNGVATRQAGGRSLCTAATAGQSPRAWLGRCRPVTDARLLQARGLRHRCGRCGGSSRFSFGRDRRPDNAVKCGLRAHLQPCCICARRPPFYNLDTRRSKRLHDCGDFTSHQCTAHAWRRFGSEFVRPASRHSPACWPLAAATQIAESNWRRASVWLSLLHTLDIVGGFLQQ
jgi:hypothetical protein